MHNKLHITRYNKTRNWAIWANEELLAVTVYRKGAQAVLDYIHTLTQNTINTMSKTKTTAAATTATNNADFDPTIIKAVNGEGKTIRIKFNPLGVSVCHNLKGTAKSRDCASTSHEKPTTKDSAAHKAAFALPFDKCPPVWTLTFIPILPFGLSSNPFRPSLWALSTRSKFLPLSRTPSLMLAKRRIQKAVLAARLW